MHAFSNRLMALVPLVLGLALVKTATGVVTANASSTDCLSYGYACTPGGTTPATVGLTNGSYEVAFQANTGSLWTVGPDNRDAGARHDERHEPRDLSLRCQKFNGGLKTPTSRATSVKRQGAPPNRER
jgi:hypothetical protein